MIYQIYQENDYDGKITILYINILDVLLSIVFSQSFKSVIIKE